MEKSLVKVLRGLADYLDLSLGDLLEGLPSTPSKDKTRSPSRPVRTSNGSEPSMD